MNNTQQQNTQFKPRLPIEKISINRLSKLDNFYKKKLAEDDNTKLFHSNTGYIVQLSSPTKYNSADYLILDETGNILEKYRYHDNTPGFDCRMVSVLNENYGYSKGLPILKNNGKEYSESFYVTSFIALPEPIKQCLVNNTAELYNYDNKNFILYFKENVNDQLSGIDGIDSSETYLISSYGEYLETLSDIDITKYKKITIINNIN